MAQEQLGIEMRVERRRAPRVATSHAALCWTFGVTEGVLAGLTMLVPALVYHVLVAHVPLAEISPELYFGYSALVGLVYGAFSAGHHLAVSR